MSIATANPFTVDEEARLAYRSEIKRKLAQVALKKQRLAELRDLVAGIDADSDKAADQHEADCQPLQDELAKLDERAIDAITAKGELTDEDTHRRREILREISDANRDLEMLTAANNKNADAIRKQIFDLNQEVAEASTLENKLRDLCSPKLRRQRKYLELKCQGLRAALAEAQRVATILRRNTEYADSKAEIWPKTDSNRIQEVRLADMDQIISQLNDELTAYQAEIDQCEQAQLDE